MKRSAYWFLGEYCCQLTAAATVAADSPQKQPPGQSPPSKPNAGSGNDLLRDVWASPAATSRSEGGGARPPLDLNGVEAGAVAHPVVAAMSGATVSILMRLKHAAMFEDFQVCRVALRCVRVYIVRVRLGTNGAQITWIISFPICGG